jgi:SAM-dependent methyltransferase
MHEAPRRTDEAEDSARFPPRLPPVDVVLASAWCEVPLALALRETHRLLTLSQILAERPTTHGILDVGVGDGSWWRHLRGTRDDVYGIDVSGSELARAGRVIPHAARIDVVESDLAGRLEREGWPRRYEGIIANCSLEHVARLDAALANLFEVLEPGGWMVMFVPTPWWAMQGSAQRLLARHAPRVAMATSGAMNGFFQHWHLMDRPTWTRLLTTYGFVVEHTLAIGDARSEALFRLMLPPSFVGFVTKQLIGRYPNSMVPDALVRPWAGAVARVITPARPGIDDVDAYEFAIRVTKPGRR